MSHLHFLNFEKKKLCEVLLRLYYCMEKNICNTYLNINIFNYMKL